MEWMSFVVVNVVVDDVVVVAVTMSSKNWWWSRIREGGLLWKIVFVFCVDVEQGRDSTVAVDGYFLEVVMVEVLVCTKSSELWGGIMVKGCNFIMVWFRFVWFMRWEMMKRGKRFIISGFGGWWLWIQVGMNCSFHFSLVECGNGKDEDETKHRKYRLWNSLSSYIFMWLCEVFWD